MPTNTITPTAIHTVGTAGTISSAPLATLTTSNASVLLLADPFTFPADSFLEAVLSRGDRRVGEVIHAAWERGAKFDAWGELGNTTTLMERIKQQLDPDHLLSPGRFSANI